MNISELENRFLRADALEYMIDMPGSSVDLIFTSPPDLSQAVAEGNYIDTLGFYEVFQSIFCQQFARIVKPGGFVVICQTDRRYKASIVANHVIYVNEMRTRGMKLKDEKIVCRTPQVDRSDLFKFTFQYLSVFTYKGTFKRCGEYLPDVIVDNQVEKHNGTPRWTIKFCETIIKTLTIKGALVFDPFAGTAPVLEAAQLMKRKYLGFEIDTGLHSIGSRKLLTV